MKYLSTLILFFSFTANATDRVEELIAKLKKGLPSVPCEKITKGRVTPKDEVKIILDVMFERDQMTRTLEAPADLNPQEKQKFYADLSLYMQALDLGHQNLLMRLLEDYKWITLSEFGPKAENHAWIIVQHSDNDVIFQKKILALFETLYPKGEVSGQSYAYLYDRVAANEGRLQRYGTQGRCTGPGVWEPYEVETPEGLDSRRKLMGLKPMNEYRELGRRYCP